jgi:protease-4
MQQFFKFLFASCLGVLLAIFVIGGISTLVIGRAISKAEEPKEVKPNSVLHLSLSSVIPEHSNNAQIDPFDLENQFTIGLTDMVTALETAKEDDNIKGAFLDVDVVMGGQASLSVLRDALSDFQEEGKFVVAYSKAYSQSSYYLASVADELMLNPMGMIDFRGYGAVVPYFKDMLDKIGVQMDVFYVGDFKGASEPYRLSNMSAENRQQIREFLEAMYDEYLTDVAVSRETTPEQLRAIANRWDGHDADKALQAGLIDKVGYRDEIMTSMRERLGLEEDDDIEFTSLSNYFKSAVDPQDYSIKDKIAIVYAEGNIVDGKGEIGQVGDKKYTRILKDLRENDKVKAVVLRVNSPGGSAMASENIWREVRLLQEEGKPVVVSMGDLAASGGYYISAAADTIYAEPNTLTGSIGVFAIFPNMSELMSEKVGINFDTVRTSQFSTGFSPFIPLSEGERQIFNEEVKDIYEVFLQRVAEGRDMTRDEVHEIAQGRVWTGRKGVELGLVDALGGLDDAIQTAANLAGVEKYRTTEYPRVKEPLQQFLEDLQGTGSDQVREILLREELGQHYRFYEQLKEMREAQGVQALHPWLLDIQ